MENIPVGLKKIFSNSLIEEKTVGECIVKLSNKYGITKNDAILLLQEIFKDTPADRLKLSVYTNKTFIIQRLERYNIDDYFLLRGMHIRNLKQGGFTGRGTAFKKKDVGMIQTYFLTRQYFQEKFRFPGTLQDLFSGGETSFAEFICGKKKISVVGELHDASEFVDLSSYSKNKNIKIILEYNGGMKIPTQTTSTFITETYKTFKKNNMVDKLEPMDYRPTFLGVEGQHILYGIFPKYTYDDIRRLFVSPFFDKQALFLVTPENYDTSLLSDIRESLHRDFLKFHHELETMSGGYAIQVKLRHLWMRVMDFFIFAEILSTRSEVDEYIIVVGQSHAENIEKHLEKICKVK